MTSSDTRQPILTPPVAIENFELFLGVIGQWNLYDFYLRSLRYAEPSGAGAVLELDLSLRADSVRRRAEGYPETEYEIGFRFAGVDVIEIANITPSHSVVIDYKFLSQEATGERGPTLYVELDFIGGQLQFLCRSITVVHAREHIISI